MFPLGIKYSTVINNSKVNSQIVLKFFEGKLNDLLVDEIEVEENRLNFKNNFFNRQGRNHIMGSVDKGYLEISQIPEGLHITYSISLVRTLVVISFMGLFLFLVSKIIYIFLLTYIWIFGGNYLITYIRQKRLFNNLIKSTVGEKILLTTPKNHQGDF